MQQTESPQPRRPSLIGQIVLGAFWGNAGMFFVAPVVTFLAEGLAAINGQAADGVFFHSSSIVDGLATIWIALLALLVAGGCIVLGGLGSLGRRTLLLRFSANAR